VKRSAEYCDLPSLRVRVCVGRPYLWGLGAFGQPGVERVLEILREELSAAMQQMGAPNVSALTPEMVIKA
jgi:4-hydroxymandelate oxidase